MQRSAIFLLDLRDLHAVAMRKLTEVKSDTDPAHSQPVFGPASLQNEVVLYTTGRHLLKSGRRLAVMVRDLHKSNTRFTSLAEPFCRVDPIIRRVSTI